MVSDPDAAAPRGGAIAIRLIDYIGVVVLCMAGAGVALPSEVPGDDEALSTAHSLL